MAKKLPKVTGIGFYQSRRSYYFHMGLDMPLYSIKNYPDFIEEVNKFLAKNLDPCFKLVYPQLVLTVKLKFDYIILREIKKIKIMANKPMMAMSYVSPYLPQDLPWYKCDGRMKWYDQGKYQDLLRE